MAKFNVNDNVVIVKNGIHGVIIDCVVENDVVNKRTKVTHLVKFKENGYYRYEQFSRKELTKVPVKTEEKKETIKVYTVPDGRGIKITLVAVVDKELVDCFYEDFNGQLIKTYNKTFRMGVAIYNPDDDEYDKEMGIKIARHRIKTSPFCSLNARFLGEFNQYTVDALMDAKARYLIDNIDKFVTPHKD